MSLLGSDLKVAFRVIKRNKFFSLINASSLVIGMTVAVLILLWTADELSFDRFHAHYSRIHRVWVDFEAGSPMRLALSMPEFGPAAVRELPRVEDAARISRPARAPVRYGDRKFQESLVCFGDNALFRLFSFPFIAGDPERALTAPHTVVITESMARKYFGGEDPMGRTLRIGGRADFTVDGVVADVPLHSHFRFHVVRSFATLYAENRRDMENWFNIQYYTYLLLAEGADPTEVEARFPDMIAARMGDALRSMGGSLDLHLQPLSGIHLRSRIGGEIAPQGDILYVALFVGIALFVLVLSGINFVNLSTARSTARAREIGVRKTMGASRGRIIRQFMTEALLYSLGSFCLAVLTISLIEPVFESLVERPLPLSSLEAPVFCGGFVLMVGIMGLLSGSYPALYLSSFRPVAVLRRTRSGGSWKSRTRNALVIIQYGISIVLIIGTITVYRQIRHMKGHDLGFRADHALVLPGLENILGRMSFDTVREEALRVPGVLKAAGSAQVPTRGIQHDIFHPEGFSRVQSQKLTRMDIGPYYLDAMGISLAAGRNFSPDLSTDSRNALLINQTVADMFGWKQPLGRSFTFRPESEEGGEPVVRKVIGVVRDFHVASLHRRIDPLVILYRPDRIRHLTLRIDASDIPGTLNRLRDLWKRLDPNRPFDYFFLDDAFDRQYRTEERVGRLAAVFCLVAVLIGSLGLYGLSAFMAERRTKEIGIRRVLGASSAGIVRLMIGEFLRLVLLANLLAWPVAVWGLSRWLGDFPYRVGVSVGTMVGAALLALLIAGSTVSLQAVRSARRDPVRALRWE